MVQLVSRAFLPCLISFIYFSGENKFDFDCVVRLRKSNISFIENFRGRGRLQCESSLLICVLFFVFLHIGKGHDQAYSSSLH